MCAMPYSIHEHKHRFSAWAAGRAATVNGCRFSIEQARLILEGAKLKQLLLGPAQLPDPMNIDVAHREWRTNVIAAAKTEGLGFTHGVAAKLINIYLKPVWCVWVTMPMPECKPFTRRSTACSWKSSMIRTLVGYVSNGVKPELRVGLNSPRTSMRQSSRTSA